MAGKSFGSSIQSVVGTFVDTQEEVKKSSNSTADVTQEDMIRMPVVEDNEVRRSPGRPKRTDGRENKSKHFNLLLRPATYARLNQIARLDDRSVSDILNTLAEDYIQSRAKDLARFEGVIQK